MDFYYLLLGHLLGDFTLQTNKIAKNKSSNLKWVLIHSIIVTTIMLFLALPFGLNLIILVLINGLTHFFIDLFKAKLNLVNPIIALLYFILDQATHITIIYIISKINIDSYSTLPFSQEIILLILAAVFVISFSAIFIQFILRILFPSNNENFFTHNERAIGNSVRFLTFLILLFSHYFGKYMLILLPIVILIIIFFYNNSWYKWMTSRYFLTKITLDITMAVFGFLLYMSQIN